MILLGTVTEDDMVDDQQSCDTEDDQESIDTEDDVVYDQETSGYDLGCMICHHDSRSIGANELSIYN